MKITIVTVLIVFFACLIVKESKAQEFINYQVKVVTDSLGTQKGTLEKISAEGVAINDGYGNYLIIKAKNIISIRLKKKGTTTSQGLLYGTVSGAAIGSLAFLDNGIASNDQLVGFLAITTLGAVVGTTYGLIAELRSNKLMLRINKNPQVFASEYQKLEKYSKAYYIDKP